MSSPSQPTQPTQPAHVTQALHYLQEHQRARLSGWRSKPYLEEPAEFQSQRTPAELSQSQAGQIIKIPPVKRDPPVLDLAQVIGAAAVDDIRRSGQMVLHSVGDTGSGRHWDLDEVVRVMTMDFHRPNPADHPALFFHLGDVCYNYRYGVPESKKGMYQPQFYSPYADYPGKIVAIPGNHDSNPQEDPHSIDAFEENFCAPLPAGDSAPRAAIDSPTRLPMYQPGVYFLLDAPFVQILGLFSNGGEHEGVIRGAEAGEEQWKFLVEELKGLAASRKGSSSRKALIVAVHHPPFSGGGGHSGSVHMSKDLDTAFKQAAVWPDAVLSGHAHNYQRFTRTVAVARSEIQVPYVVAGNGGHNITPLRTARDRRPVQAPLRGTPGKNGNSDHSLRQYFNGFGHLIVTVTARVLTIDLIGTNTGSEAPVDSVTVDLSSRTITHETGPLQHPAAGE